MKNRKASKKRKTEETEIKIKLNIDGTGESKIKTSIGLLDHMLQLFAFWGHFDLDVDVKKGDLNIDIHHTNEDIGIVLGQVFKEALGDKIGIKRIGSASVPMEDAVASVVTDISGRGFLKFPAAIQFFSNTNDGYEIKDAGHFFESFASHLGMNLSIDLHASNNTDLHTNLEPVFKALGIALDQATQIDPRRKGIPSTKGIID
ncbi:MAG: imidazoleglycerol-phosphate dehydratase [Candidatus Omnitrophica bacterium CG_4_9_14_0_2_um_filter_43_12]|nr:MAG: imidazoleglycerol-phosphate dehydratase [Candidatus Omnitrophica bacterium CG_4_9_14_0_2_um_filter_43_12]